MRLKDLMKLFDPEKPIRQAISFTGVSDSVKSMQACSKRMRSKIF